MYVKASEKRMYLGFTQCSGSHNLDSLEEEKGCENHSQRWTNTQLRYLRERSDITPLHVTVVKTFFYLSKSTEAPAFKST